MKFLWDYRFWDQGLKDIEADTGSIHLKDQQRVMPRLLATLPKPSSMSHLILGLDLSRYQKRMNSSYQDGEVLHLESLSSG